jgi:hypothetical protein
MQRLSAYPEDARRLRFVIADGRECFEYQFFFCFFD